LWNKFLVAIANGITTQLYGKSLHWHYVLADITETLNFCNFASVWRFWHCLYLNIQSCELNSSMVTPWLMINGRGPYYLWHYIFLFLTHMIARASFECWRMQNKTIINRHNQRLPVFPKKYYIITHHWPWFIWMYHGKPWFIWMYHGKPWFIWMYHGKPWCMRYAPWNFPEILGGFMIHS